jgi:phospholipase/carboxylesterase
MNRSAAAFVHKYLPASAPGQPTLLLLHGTGGNEGDLIPIGTTLAPGAALLSPRGQVLERGAPRFFRRLAEGIFDLDDLAVRTEALADFIEAAAAEYELDASRVIAVGYSNGANIAASVLLRRPSVLAGAILFRAMVPFEPDAPPDLSGVAVLIGSGQHDPIVPRAQPERLRDLLSTAGAAVEMYWYAGGHELADHDLQAARRWLNARPLAGAGVDR